MSKRLSKYVASFDYFDKSLIVLSVITGINEVIKRNEIINNSLKP